MANELSLSVVVNTAAGNANIAGFNRNLGSIGDAASRASATAGNAMSGLEQRILKVSASVRNGFSTATTAVIAAFSSIAVKSLYDVVAGFERSRIGLKAFLGDATKAEEFFKQIQTFSFISPFQFKDLLEQGRQLLAYGFNAKEAFKLVQGISAIGGGLNFDRGKLQDIVNAFGQIRAAGRLTGQELAQLRNAGVPAIEGLAAAYGVSAAKMKDAIEKGIVPAGEAITIIGDLLNNKFGTFAGEVAGTLSVSVSNVIDILQKVADDVTKDITPEITAALQSIIPKVEEVGKSFVEFTHFVRDNWDTIKELAISVEFLGEALVAAKIFEQLTAAAAAMEAFTLAAVASPLVLFSLGVAATGIAIRQFRNELADREDLANKSFIRKMINGGKTEDELKKIQAQLKELGFTSRQVGDALNGDVFEGVKGSGLQLSPLHASLKIINNTKKDADKDEEKRKFKLAENAAKEAKHLAQLEGRADEVLDKARKRELTDLPRIIQQHKEYVEELGKTAAARRSLGEAFTLNIGTETEKERKKQAEQILKDWEVESEKLAQIYTKRGKDELEFSAETEKLRYDNLFAIRVDGERAYLEHKRAQDLAALDGSTKQTIDAQLATTQARLAIDEEYYRKVAELDKFVVDERVRLEIDAIDRSKISASAAADRELALGIQAEVQRAKIATNAQDEIEKAQISAGTRSVGIIRDNTDRIFTAIKQKSDAVFGDMLRNGQSIFSALGSIIKNTFLTVIRDIISSQVAKQLTQLVTGQNVSFPSSRGATGTSGGIFGGFGGILQSLGLGGVAAFGGGGGVFSPGSPGGTPGFAGPVGGGAGVGSAGSQSGLGALASAGGLAGGKKGLLGFLSSLGNIGFGPKGGDFGGEAAGSFNGVGGAKGGALLAGGAILGFDGLRRGGLAGLAETTAGGALIGAKFGGPLGAAIGAGIGAAAGGIRLLIKSADEKIVKGVKTVYNIDISKDFAHTNIFPIIKNNFGGNIDVGLRSNEVRDLVELYAMTFGQVGGRGFAVPQTPLSLSQRNGVISTTPSTLSGSEFLPNGGSGIGTVPVGPTQVNIFVDGDATTKFHETGMLSVLTENGRAVSSAVSESARSFANPSLAEYFLTPGVVAR